MKSGTGTIEQTRGSHRNQASNVRSSNFASMLCPCRKLKLASAQGSASGPRTYQQQRLLQGGLRNVFSRCQGTEKQVLGFEPASRFEYVGDEHHEQVQDRKHQTWWCDAI